MLAYYLLTALNILLMVVLAKIESNPFFRLYLLVMAGAAALQNTEWWGLTGEVILAVFTLQWIASVLLPHAGAWLFATGIAIAACGAVDYGSPPPWPNYPGSWYFVRMYSTVIALAWACSILVWNGFRHRPLSRSVLISVLWFSAVLFAQMQRGLPYVPVGIAANAVWTACLVGWLILRPSGRAIPRGAPRHVPLGARQRSA